MSANKWNMGVSKYALGCYTFVSRKLSRYAQISSNKGSFICKGLVSVACGVKASYRQVK
jgi:hypothetical protein